MVLSLVQICYNVSSGPGGITMVSRGGSARDLQVVVVVVD